MRRLALVAAVLVVTATLVVWFVTRANVTPSNVAGRASSAPTPTRDIEPPQPARPRRLDAAVTVLPRDVLLPLVDRADTVVVAATTSDELPRAARLALDLRAPLVVVGPQPAPSVAPTARPSSGPPERLSATADAAAEQAGDPSAIADELRASGVQRVVAIGGRAAAVADAGGVAEITTVDIGTLPPTDAATVLEAASRDPRMVQQSPSPSPATVRLPDEVTAQRPVRAAPSTGAVVLVRPGAPDALPAAVAARAVGHVVVATRARDVRADPAVIERLSALSTTGPAPPVVLAGSGFAQARTDEVAAHVATAATGRQLPGGGQLVLDGSGAAGRRYVGLYGTPGSPSLGVLGEQPIRAAITRAERLADDYRAVVDDEVMVVPTFEIIATVASGQAGSDGNYSNERSVADLEPWVDAAADADVLVLLDLQPGRSDFLAQAKRYERLLRRPNVGLALDPEWRLGPDERHLEQIGSVGIAEVNRVANWLADLVAERRLPQKMLLIHQFRLSMVADRARLDTTRDELAYVIQMDGQGTRAEKRETWAAVTAAAPDRAAFGWKNFYDEDVPLWTPAQTMARDPAPVFVSYQ